MQVTETLSEGLKRELKVVVPAKELDGKLQTRLDDLKGRVRINGFRPGKVPAAHLKRLYGKSVMAEIVQETVTETSQKAIEERKEKPAFQPSIAFSEDEKEIEGVMQGEADLAYTMAFEILPEIELADFSKIAVEKEVAEVADAEIDEALDRIGQQNKPYEPKKKGAAAENGDRATIDYVGKIDGEPFEGGSEEGANILIGSGMFIPGFEEQLVGAKAGQDKVVKVTFPENYPAKHLAGKAAEFDVKVAEISAPGEVKLDDEFAKSLGMDSLDKVKEAIRAQIGSEYEAAVRRKLKRRILDALDETHAFDLPPTLVEQEFQAIWRQVEADLQRSGKTFADEDTTEEAAREDYQKIAERRVRLGLVLAEVGRRNDIQISEDEVQRALVERIRQFPGQEQQVWEFYRKNPQAMAEIRAPIFEDKVIDYIVELAKVTEKAVSREVLFTDPDEDGEGEDDGKKKAAKPKAAKAKKAKKEEKAD